METLKRYNIHLKGISPLIMHSDKLCNPLHPMTKRLKEITCIKSKKDEHHYAMARIEWEGALYYDDEIGIHIPSKCLRGCFKSAAKKFKLGKATKAITIDCPIGTPLIGYEKLNPEKLWAIKNKKDEQSHVFCETVVVNRARIMRTRPIFPKWEVKFDVYLNHELFSIQQLESVINTAGFEYGLCELRPENATGTFGRFTLEGIKPL
jgi:hypothetical protein